MQYEAPAKNAKGKVKVPAFVKVNGVTYQVTSVSGKAFKGNSKVTKIIIGKNVTKIGKKAFSKCKKLKLLVIKSRKLKTKNVAKNAFKGITKKTTVKVLWRVISGASGATNTDIDAGRSGGRETIAGQK